VAFLYVYGGREKTGVKAGCVSAVERVNNQMNRWRGITFQTPIHAGEHSWRGGESLVMTGEKYARYPFLFPDMSGYGGVRGWG
jgi:hypothetical protein